MYNKAIQRTVFTHSNNAYWVLEDTPLSLCLSNGVQRWYPQLSNWKYLGVDNNMVHLSRGHRAGVKAKDVAGS